ncbi:AAA family ATPase [Candidatus Woesearchaeota archaeon]|jgi:hypothetical protein|nr:AAA family ATPase [Candidatus Woesearchaeota archaeon]MBT5272760.1 AAA family ATPase [Candidatus Woesearchaeota archaeon]MBT6040372.1 AAA family ATPase [Candidatus Woesearchaeota archaeon]MBT6336995.1 AAA family ATPase [Candidatus Woesearchaeota archaeon]MBT7926881.1 AAA family ATPase [Candidatus Woesearchaeota archaeon]
MTWYTELKFAKNPLDIRPNPNLIGLKDQEKTIVNHILKDDICFVNGLTGSGKSSMLKRIQRILKSHEFIYLDAHDLPPKFNLEKELKKKRNFFDKITFREYPKEKPVLIIDEFQATDPRLILNARSKWENPDKRTIKSIVVAQISQHLENCSQSFKERIGSKIVQMRLLNHDELKEMLRRRLFNRRAKTNFVQKFNEEALDLIVKSAGKNPRKVLEYAEMIFDHHHKRFGDINPILRTDYEVSHHVARQVLEENGVYVEKNKIKKSKVSKIEEKKSDNEQKTQISEGLEKEILQYLNAEPRTVKDVAKQFDLSNNKAKKQIDVLRKNNHLIPKGKKGRMKLWDVNAETKRLLVES